MSVISIPAGTQFSYNGVVFPVFCKTKVTEEAVFSEDGRVIKYSKITISVSGFFTQDDADFYSAANGLAFDQPLDAVMLSIRRKLQVAGKALYYKGRGYGTDLAINDPTNAGSIFDVAMGPRPGEFSWWSLGGAPDGCHGAGFEFSVSTCIPECGAFPTNPGPNVFVQIAYTASYDVAEDGLVTITTRGSAQIPLSLRGGANLIRTVDDSIAAIIKPVAVGFLRSNSRQISADRATCEFTITDKQMEVPPPPNVVHIDMKQRLRQTARYAPKFTGNISGTVRLQPGAVKAYAWQVFMNLAAYRISLARWNCQHPGNLGGAVVESRANGNVLPGTIEFEEDLFKNESRFSINFDIMGAPWSEIVRLSGMWTPIINPTPPAANMLGDAPNQFRRWTWEDWNASLATNAQRYKGLLGASFSNVGDVVLDVCNVTNRAAVNVAGVYDADPDDITKKSEAGAAKVLPNLSAAVLNTPDDGGGRFDVGLTWLNWECHVERITDHHIVRHKPLSGDVTYDTPPADPFGPAIQLQGDTSAPTAGWSATVPDFFQQTAAPSMMVRIRGIGVRIGYRVNPPKAISFGGVTPVLANEWISESTLGAQNAVMYRTEWQLDYLLPTAPTAIPVMADPVLGTDSITGNGSQATGDLGGTDGLTLGTGDGGNPNGLIMAH